MNQRSMDLLKYRSFPGIGAAVRACADQVVEAWLQIAKENVPAAGGLTADELRDHLAMTLRGMAETLESDQPMTLAELMDKATIHGDVRFDQRYNLSELLTEYSLIRPILIDHVNEFMDRPMDATEIVALNLSVDVAVKQGVLAFASHQKAQLEAGANSRAKYLSFLSHDLRGGLNGTLLMIEVLRRELKNHEQFAESVQDLEAMRRSILDTVGTMDRFLHAEKLRNGKIQPRLGQVNLHHLVRDIVSQLSWTAKEKGVTVEPKLDGDGMVTSDRELLVLIVQNLMSNAIKYCKGQVSLTVTKHDSGNTIIAVCDNGPGIAAEFLSKMFAPYARGDTHGEAGNGLGLFIARQSADLLGAKLWGESTVGQGSRFYVEIPEPKAVAMA
ncbi:MAG TPA: HAMP domain-containing sensor histidine kinase [Tepidisphaeraceae bacterium]|nr:HAMP domain-containing sensor histidine kinase [Tepidisphaeraceae bacterium]